MKRRRPIFAWKATLIFYLVLMSVVTISDWWHGVLTLNYLAIQTGLITLGVGLFALVGYKYHDLSAQRGVLLAFSVGVFTIIPGVLMSLNPQGENFWPEYFQIGMSMAAGSLLGFLFIEFSNRFSKNISNPYQEDQDNRRDT